jgi:hypothetical protein
MGLENLLFCSKFLMNFKYQMILFSVSFIHEKFSSQSFIINCSEIVDDILRRPEIDEKFLNSYLDFNLLKLNHYPILAFDDVDRFQDVDNLWTMFLDWISYSKSILIIMTLTSFEKFGNNLKTIYDHSTIFSIPQLKSIDRKSLLNSFTNNEIVDDLQMITDVD